MTFKSIAWVMNPNNSWCSLWQGVTRDGHKLAQWGFAKVRGLPMNRAKKYMNRFAVLSI